MASERGAAPGGAGERIIKYARTQTSTLHRLRQPGDPARKARVWCGYKPLFGWDYHYTDADDGEACQTCERAYRAYGMTNAERRAGALPDLRRSKLISSDGRMHVAVKREEHRGCVSYRVVPVYHDDGPDATFARRSEALRVAAAIIAEYERKIGGKHGDD